MKKIFLIISFSLMVQSAFCQWTPDSMMNTLVADSSGIIEYNTRVASGPYGSTYISWFRRINPNPEFEVYMQRLDSNGFEMWTPGGVLITNHLCSSSGNLYDLQADNYGNVVIAFEDEGSGPVFSVLVFKLDMYGNHLFNPNGTTLTHPLAKFNSSPQIGFNNSNETIIVWNASDTISNHWISFQKLDNSGIPVFPAIQSVIDSSAIIRYSHPSIVAASDALGFIIQYVQESVDSLSLPVWYVYAKRYDGNATEVWNTLVSSDAIVTYSTPKAVSDLYGGFYVALTVNSSTSIFTDVRMQRVDSIGNLWLPQGVPVSNALNESRSYTANCLAVRPGGVNVAFVTSNSSQNQYGIAMQEFDMFGINLHSLTAAIIFPYSPLVYSPLGFADAGSGSILIYSLGNFMGSLNLDLRAHWFVYGTSGWDRSLSKVYNSKQDIGTGKVYINQLVVAWTDFRLDEGVYAQNISSYGNAGILSVDETEFYSSLTVSPNPGHNPEFRLAGNPKGATSFEILDIQGRILYSDQFQGSSFIPDIQLPSGLYLVRLLNKEYPATVRWMVP